MKHHGVIIPTAERLGSFRCLQRPDSWLKKTLEVQKAALWLDERQADGQHRSRQPALLRLPRLTAGALLPIFAIIESTPQAAVGEELKAAVDLSLEQVESAVNKQQLEWLRTFAGSLSAMQAASQGQSLRLC